MCVCVCVCDFFSISLGAIARLWSMIVGIPGHLLNVGWRLRKRGLRTYANSEDPDQTAHPRSLVRIFAVRLHSIGTLLKI